MTEYASHFLSFYHSPPLRLESYAYLPLLLHTALTSSNCCKRTHVQLTCYSPVQQASVKNIIEHVSHSGSRHLLPSPTARAAAYYSPVSLELSSPLQIVAGQPVNSPSAIRLRKMHTPQTASSTSVTPHLAFFCCR